MSELAQAGKSNGAAKGVSGIEPQAAAAALLPVVIGQPTPQLDNREPIVIVDEKSVAPVPEITAFARAIESYKTYRGIAHQDTLKGNVVDSALRGELFGPALHQMGANLKEFRVNRLAADRVEDAARVLLSAVQNSAGLGRTERLNSWYKPHHNAASRMLVRAAYRVLNRGAEPQVKAVQFAKAYNLMHATVDSSDMEASKKRTDVARRDKDGNLTAYGLAQEAMAFVEQKGLVPEGTLNRGQSITEADVLHTARSGWTKHVVITQEQLLALKMLAEVAQAGQGGDELRQAYLSEKAKLGTPEGSYTETVMAAIAYRTTVQPEEGTQPTQQFILADKGVAAFFRAAAVEFARHYHAISINEDIIARHTELQGGGFAKDVEKQKQELLETTATLFEGLTDDQQKAFYAAIISGRAAGADGKEVIATAAMRVPNGERTTVKEPPIDSGFLRGYRDEFEKYVASRPKANAAQAAGAALKS